jgi:hypothetical protein
VSGLALGAGSGEQSKLNAECFHKGPASREVGPGVEKLPLVRVYQQQQKHEQQILHDSQKPVCCFSSCCWCFLAEIDGSCCFHRLPPQVWLRPLLKSLATARTSVGAALYRAAPLHAEPRGAYRYEFPHLTTQNIRNIEMGLSCLEVSLRGPAAALPIA